MAKDDTPRDSRGRKREPKATCRAKNKAGRKCRAYRLKGSLYCSAHQPDTADHDTTQGTPVDTGKHRFGTSEYGRAGGLASGRVRKPPMAPLVLMRKAVEKAAAEMVRVEFLLAGFDFVVDDDGDLVLDDDGAPEIELVDWDRDDAPNRVHLLERREVIRGIYDRVYGRARQAHEVSGAGGEPVKVELPKGDDVDDALARHLVQSGLVTPEAIASVVARDSA